MPRFSDILGQQTALEVLSRAISAQRIAQAYLFTGPEGVGKCTTALAFAAALNCEEAAGQGCDTCPACRRIAEGLHPDVLHLRPEGASIKIDQVRALEPLLGYSPHEGKYRVVIIDGADLLNLHAANALLKSVEEPRPFTLFVLVTSALHRVAPTLISRCQRLRFLPLAQDTVLALLARGQPEKESALLHAAAALAEGSMKRASGLLEAEGLEAMQKAAQTLLQATRGPSILPVFEAASEAGKDRLWLIEMLDLLKVWLRDLMLVVEGLEDQEVIHAERIASLRQEAATMPYRSVLRQIHLVDEAQAALRGNVQPALALENLILHMRQVVLP